MVPTIGAFINTGGITNVLKKSLNAEVRTAVSRLTEMDVSGQLE